MEILRTLYELNCYRATLALENSTLALVPTMGALHAGHLSLIELGKQHANRVMASVFVNPTQFGPNEDFSRYPRQPEADAALLEDAGCDALYLPDVETIYPEGFATTVSVRGLDAVLCGAHRPGHFDGVATVVTKLLLQTLPDAAVFGEKDFQQLTIIRRLVADLNIPVNIMPGPIMREDDGLAMSSRNAYLSKDDRAAAPVIYRTLTWVAETLNEGERPPAVLREAKARLLGAGFSEVDYFELRSRGTLAELERFAPGESIVLTAAKIGKTRLIDNLQC